MSIDVYCSGMLRCLDAPLDLASITHSEAAMRLKKNRYSMVQRVYLNLQDLEGYPGRSRRSSYHHTTSIPMTYDLRGPLRIVMDESIEDSIDLRARPVAPLRNEREALELGCWPTCIIA